MNLINDLIQKVETQLKKWVTENTILNYQILIQSDSTLEIKLLVTSDSELDEENIYSVEPFKSNERVIFITQFVDEDYEDDFKKMAFEGKEKVNKNFRRQLKVLLDPKNQELSVPIITFYSYKGGLGRTTALACFAAYMARIEGKKVVVVDCDFEAPGFSSGNYFFIDNTQPKNGVVEYLMDKEFSSHFNENINLKEYSYSDIDESFTSSTHRNSENEVVTTNGELYIIPAGNTQNQDVYLESLARIDFSSNLKGFIEDIQNTFSLTPENSLILFDSRTGFNDTFAALAEFSDVLVGLFGINEQNKAGIEFFINHFYQNGHKKVCFVKGLGNYKELDTLSNIIKMILQEKENQKFEYKVSYIENNDLLKDLGALNIRIDDSKVIEELKVESNEFKNFLDEIMTSNRANLKTLFATIWNFAKPNKTNAKNNQSTIEEKKQILDKDSKTNTFSKEKIRNIKRTFLTNIDYPLLSAEEYNIAQVEKEFFFRICMQDIFNKSKFIIVGGKGAGKTFLYKTLDDNFSQKIIDKICRLSNKNKNNFIFINTINAEEPKTIQALFNNVADFSRQTYDAYWKLLSCYMVFSNSKVKQEFDFDKDFNYWIKETINNSLSIDQEKLDETLSTLRKVNSYLKSEGKKIVLSFDKLDRIVPLGNWKIAISSLIDFWRDNADYSHILPKIFIRSDLFNAEKIEANNFLSLKQYSVLDIAWEKEELFAQFFKIILRKKDDRSLFYEYLRAYQYANKFFFNDIDMYIKDIEISIEKTEQLHIITEELKKLVIVCFDETADFQEQNRTKYPSSYDWFYNNLQDGNEQTNLRSFWKLIELSIKGDGVNRNKCELNKTPINTFPLISPRYYTEKIHREQAAKVYYDELKSEEGNHSLIDFARFFQDNKEKFERKYNYYDTEFKHIISLFIERNKDTEILSIIDKTSKERQVESIISWLVNNGVVKEIITEYGKHTKYIFPYFYRSIFNLV